MNAGQRMPLGPWRLEGECGEKYTINAEMRARVPNTANIRKNTSFLASASSALAFASAGPTAPVFESPPCSWVSSFGSWVG